MNRIKALVVDDHVLFRKGLVNLLSSQRDIEVVGEGDNGIAGLEMARAMQTDIILMDISMPVCDGLEATRLIRAEMPLAKVIILTVSDSEQHLFQAIKAGAYGYLLKNLEPEQLFAFIRRATQGESPISPGLVSKILTELSRRTAPEPEPADALSPREREVLQLVALGTTNREIAASLSITENTVKNHLKSILGKLRLRNRVEITAYAFKHGLAR